MELTAFEQSHPAAAEAALVDVVTPEVVTIEVVPDPVEVVPDTPEAP